MQNFSTSFLYTPGPATTPRRILDAYARPLLHHRTPEFSDVLKTMEAKLRWLFATEAVVLPVFTSGRGALEANIVNFCSPGDEIICLCNGRFATMVAEIADIYGVRAHRVCTDWLKAPDLRELEAACEAHPEAKLVTVCMNESSTGVLQPIRPVGDIAHRHGMACVADAVSIAGGYPIDFDDSGADAVTIAAQKCLMCAPGISFTVLNDTAWELCARSTLPKFLQSYPAIRRKLIAERSETPGTTPITAVYGVIEALTMMQEEGREQVFARHLRNARATRAAVRALGFTLFPYGIPEGNLSVTLTSFTSEDPSRDLDALRSMLKAEHGLSIAGSTAKEFVGRMLRIGHMGWCYRRDILTLFTCMEDCMIRLGWLDRPGRGIEAALAVYNE